MSRLVFAACWVFIFAVALFDSAFAWTYRETFTQWELNQAAIGVYECVGMAWLLGGKLFFLVLAFLAAYLSLRENRFMGVFATVVVTLAHVITVAFYLVGYYHA